ncbi:MAG TPA: hypothetical protein VG225_02980 [Terracidiphilus sp.]|jgi:hypothetical protein|nr:hypothetical protein [Terracidiphilus sp.]
MENARRRWLAGLLWVASVVLAFCGGVLAEYGRDTNHPIAASPIKVDYCYLFSHEDLFRGQPVETEAHYVQVIEGGGIGRDECPDNDAAPLFPNENEPSIRAWEDDLHKDWYTAEYNMRFVGVIPSYPRYRHWLADARNQWLPTHHVPAVRIQRITSFTRTR